MTAIPVILHELPDTPAAPVGRRPRGRDHATQKRGGDFRVRIHSLEDDLADSKKEVAQLKIDLARARETATRLSEVAPGRCHTLRSRLTERNDQLAERNRQLEERDGWLEGWRKENHDLKKLLASQAANSTKVVNDQRKELAAAGLAEISAVTLRVQHYRDERNALRLKLASSDQALRHAQWERAITSTKLSAAEQALRYAQRERVSTSNKLVACQERLLSLLGRDGAAGLISPVSPAPSSTRPHSGAAAAPLARPSFPSPPQGLTTVIPDSASDADGHEILLLESIASLLTRCPDADLRAYNLRPGEPVSDDDDPADASPRRHHRLEHHTRPISIASGTTSDSAYDPPSPKPEGATSLTSSPRSSATSSPEPAH